MINGHAINGHAIATPQLGFGASLKWSLQELQLLALPPWHFSYALFIYLAMEVAA